jgi:type I restriction enzyme M protein
MGEKGNDGGQFFTPRKVIRTLIRTLIRAINPQPRQTDYDPAAAPAVS